MQEFRDTLTLYNTKARKKEPLRPLKGNRVSLYVCGPTVYDRAHLGNARSVVVFDVLFRLLRALYGESNVTYVRNITDIDDKINARAHETGKPIAEITQETTAWFHQDMEALGALAPTHEPRATDHIDEMIAMIACLIARENAYVAEGHVLFRVGSYSDYGKLSGRSLEDMRAGAGGRIEPATFKENPLDFVLWKPSAPALPGWDSPWGRGRPGWHIECSAMSKKLLGDAFDIHGGGHDLLFPHHENEIAQSVCAEPESGFASIWMHNEMLKIGGEKMSKSLGNFLTVRDLLEKGIDGEVIRLVLLSAHYRKSLDWTMDKVKEARGTLHKWRTLIKETPSSDQAQAQDQATPDPEFMRTLCDDLNMAGAISILHKLANAGQGQKLRACAHILGLLGSEMSQTWRNDAGGLAPLGALTKCLNEMRDEALKTRDFRAFDCLRGEFLEAGIEVRMDKKGVALLESAEVNQEKLKQIAENLGVK